MFSELGRKPLVTLSARAYRVLRVSLAIMSVLIIGMGAFALLARDLPDPDGRLMIGLWFILFGSSCLMFVWLGRWRPAETDEEKAREALLSRRMQPFIDGVELLFLTIALIGLLAPSRLGALWPEYRPSLVLFALLIALDFGQRIRRRKKLAAEQPVRVTPPME